MILSELIKSSDKYQDDKSGRFLFKGQSCYPISPAGDKENNTVSKNDQFIKILQRYPNLNKDVDLSFLSNDDQLSYFDSCRSIIASKSDITSKFSQSSPGLVNLL